MTPISLACPSCSAPLQFENGQQRTLCLYCGSTIQAERATSAVTFTLPEDVHLQLKQLVIDGRQAEAIELYRQRANVTQTEAAQTLSRLVADLTRRTLVQQPLSNFGLALVFLIDSLGAVIMLWGLMNENYWAVALGIGAIVIESMVFAAAIYAWIIHRFGRAAPAVVRRFTRLGEIKVRGQAQPLPVVRLWLEVQPANQTAFQVESNIVAKPQTYAQLRPGLSIEVKHNGAGRVIPTAPMKILT